MIEEWKDIDGFEGIYQVSNFGNIKRISPCRRYPKEHLIKPYIVGNGYKQVKLSKDGVYSLCKVSRLVASAFIPNPNLFPEVNHIDENKTNDFANNLEWCDHLYNSRYGTRGKRIGKANSKQIIQCDLLGVFIRKWDSISEAARYYNVDSSNISKCLLGKYSNAFGYVWKYKK